MGAIELYVLAGPAFVLRIEIGSLNSHTLVSARREGDFIAFSMEK